MPAVVQSPHGAVLNHKNLIWLPCKNDRKEHHESGSSRKHFKWKKELNAIYTPFYMDSQAARIQRQEELDSEEISERCDNVKVCKQTSADRKRKRKRSVPLSGNDLKISSYLRTNLLDLICKAKKHNIVSDARPEILTGSDNNKQARQAAAVLGGGEVFQDLCEESQTFECGTERIIHLEHRDAISPLSPSFIINKLVCNGNDTGISLTLGGDTFLIPPHSRFLTSSLSKFVSHLYKYVEVSDGYDVLVMDPPWTNKSVKRKKSYQSLLETELGALPVQHLTKPGSLVIVWITNNLRIESYVKEKLFPCWHVEYITDWIWMKVTVTGMPVLDLHSHHKKPYERLVIGKVLPLENEENAVESEFIREGNQDVLFHCPVVEKPDASVAPVSDVTCLKSPVHHKPSLPKDYILLSVPYALHSKKPPLKDVLRPYLPSNPKCLELFARNLLPGWTSWGNEPLRHQHMDFFEGCQESDDEEIF